MLGFAATIFGQTPGIWRATHGAMAFRRSRGGEYVSVMASRIVLYGATGYTGTLTAQALVADGVRLVLAGRNQGRLAALAARLAQTDGGTEPETAVVDAERPGLRRDLLGPGDVLVSTAGRCCRSGGRSWPLRLMPARFTSTPPANRCSSARCSRISVRWRNGPARCC